MPTLHELFAESIDGRASLYAADAVGPDALTASRIAGVRRRRAVAAGTTSALAVGGLLVAGALLRDGGRGADDPAASASPEPGAMATAVVDLNSLPRLGWTVGWDRYFECGEPIGPEQSYSNLDGFSQQVDIGDTTALTAGGHAVQIHAKIAYDGEPHAPVFVDAGYALLAQDGVVVGTFGDASWSGSPPFEGLKSGESWETYITSRAFDSATTVMPCDAPTEDMQPDLAALEAGTYQVYVVSRALVAEPLVAQYSLVQQGLMLGSEERSTWSPGSIDCASLETGMAGQPMVVQCDPSIAPSVKVDASAQTAMVPYAADLYTDDVDVKLVSEPIDVVVPATLTWSDLGQHFEPPGADPNVALYVDASDLSCDSGAFFAGGGAPVSARVTGRTSIDRLTVPQGVPVQMDLDSGEDAGWIDVETPTQAWLIARTSDSTQSVVGWGTATVDPQGRIAVDRAAGYPDVTLQLSDPTWCGAAPNILSGIVLTAQVDVSSGIDRETGGPSGPQSEQGLWIDLD